MTGEMVISAESVSYLDSVELMQLGSNATIRHVGLFGMLQLCLELFMSQFSHHSTLYALRPLLGGEPYLAICGIVEGLVGVHLWLQPNKLGDGLSARLILELAHHLVVSRMIEWTALLITCEIELILDRPHGLIEVIGADFIHEGVRVGEEELDVGPIFLLHHVVMEPNDGKDYRTCEYMRCGMIE